MRDSKIFTLMEEDSTTNTSPVYSTVIKTKMGASSTKPRRRIVDDTQDRYKTLTLPKPSARITYNYDTPKTEPDKQTYTMPITNMSVSSTRPPKLPTPAPTHSLTKEELTTKIMAKRRDTFFDPNPPSTATRMAMFSTRPTPPRKPIIRIPATFPTQEEMLDTIVKPVEEEPNDFAPIDMDLVDEDVINMLTEEVRMRRSPEFQYLAKWGHKDNNGNTMSTNDNVELYIQTTLLKKYGYPSDEEWRVTYLKRCHELYNSGNRRVRALNAPHLAHNPYDDTSQNGTILNGNLVSSTGESVDLEKITSNSKNTVIVTGSMT